MCCCCYYSHLFRHKLRTEGGFANLVICDPFHPYFIHHALQEHSWMKDLVFGSDSLSCQFIQDQGHPDMIKFFFEAYGQCSNHNVLIIYQVAEYLFYMQMQHCY